MGEQRVREKGKEGGISRRAFLQFFGISAAGLVLSVHFGPLPAEAKEKKKPEGDELRAEAFVQVGRDGKVTLFVPRVEMGQAVYTAIIQLVAEELDVDPNRFVLEHAPPNDAVYGLPSGGQITGGSTTIRGLWIPMRQVGALTRALFVSAAAEQWDVEPKACRTDNGVVFHDRSGRKIAYGALIDLIGNRVPERIRVPRRPFFDVSGNDRMEPADLQSPVPLKDRKKFKVIGKSIPRADGAEKVRGETLFGIDVRVPDMLVGTVMASPVFMGTLSSVDDSKARKIEGVRQIVKLDDAVAVIGDHFWAAKQGLQALMVSWDEGAHANVSNSDVVSGLSLAADLQGLLARKEGNIEKGLSRAARRIDAVYEVPFLAHAPMEPPNCTVHVKKESCEVWVGTQVPAMAQRAVAEVTGLSAEKVTVHNHYLGGGFGRRLEVDFIRQAAKIAMKVDRPVKIVWTREEDIQQDLYRPYYYDRISAGLDKSGNIVAWNHRIVGSSVTARYLPGELSPDGLDFDAIDGAGQMPYRIPNIFIDYVRAEPPGVPTGYWRGVGATHNVFVIESFVDELARASGEDPFEFRRRHLSMAPRAKAVLERVAKESGWAKPLPARKGRGIAVGHVFGSWLAQMAEVSVSDRGDIRVERVLCAVDCGICVNPGHVKAQIESGILFGLGPVILDAITIEKGRVQQSNFHDYRVVRMSDAPKIDIFLVDSGAAPGGIGETSTTLIAPAVANAVFMATGKRIRKLPMEKKDLAISNG